MRRKHPNECGYTGYACSGIDTANAFYFIDRCSEHAEPPTTPGVADISDLINELSFCYLPQKLKGFTTQADHIIRFDIDAQDADKGCVPSFDPTDAEHVSFYLFDKFKNIIDVKGCDGWAKPVDGVLPFNKDDNTTGNIIECIFEPGPLEPVTAATFPDVGITGIPDSEAAMQGFVPIVQGPNALTQLLATYTQFTFSPTFAYSFIPYLLQNPTFITQITTQIFNNEQVFNEFVTNLITNPTYFNQLITAIINNNQYWSQFFYEYNYQIINNPVNFQYFEDFGGRKFDESGCSQFKISLVSGTPVQWGAVSLEIPSYQISGGIFYLNGNRISVQGRTGLLPPFYIYLNVYLEPSQDGYSYTGINCVLETSTGGAYSIGIGGVNRTTKPGTATIPTYTMFDIVQERCTASADMVRTPGNGVMFKTNGSMPFGTVQTATCDENGNPL